MNQADCLRDWMSDVQQGRLARRDFVARVVAAGLSVPVAGHLLMHAGAARAQARPGFQYKPTRRGGGGTLRLLMWQGPTLLNPHFATGSKDASGARLFYEPLAYWDNDANLVPVLAAEIPSIANGGVAKDGRSVTWKLKRGVTWHDGKPFTADDCVFNWEYATDPAAAAVSVGGYANLKVEKIDAHTVRVVFPKPTPFWATAFIDTPLVPRHVFDSYRGAKSREAPGNLKPVGTGPYKFAEFVPGDMLRGTLNPTYHMPNRPFFDAFELKGGGDATSAARAVLQTGEYDHAWNLQVEDEVLRRLEEGGKGRATIVPTADVEFIFLNTTDPWTEVDGERASAKSKHFAFSDTRVRQAMALLIDRKSIQEFIWGRAGKATANWVNGPARFASTHTRMVHDPAKAAQMLDAAGWKKGADGLREKDGRKMKLVFQSSTNSIRQKTQQVIKQACQKVGIDMELKSISASVFFSSDVGNPDTNSKFWADVQMYGVQWGSPDPLRAMERFVSWEVASKANKWQGRNITRWRSDDIDRMFREAESEMDPVKRAATIIRMNDIVVDSGAIIPLVARSRVHGAATKLVPNLSAWDTDYCAIHDWYKNA